MPSHLQQRTNIHIVCHCCRMHRHMLAIICKNTTRSHRPRARGTLLCICGGVGREEGQFRHEVIAHPTSRRSGDGPAHCLTQGVRRASCDSGLKDKDVEWRQKLRSAPEPGLERRACRADHHEPAAGAAAGQEIRALGFARRPGPRPTLRSLVARSCTLSVHASKLAKLAFLFASERADRGDDAGIGPVPV